ncbi:uncharacterized protein JCM6883_001249 [Sporobolomyces salmoneus]|uniref:uncharacterized protein n=1 Tax=Sporobolomyces salmoneus TaxID=183962 RepID=UPI00317AB94E
MSSNDSDDSSSSDSQQDPNENGARQPEINPKRVRKPTARAVESANNPALDSSSPAVSRSTPREPNRRDIFVLEPNPDFETAQTPAVYDFADRHPSNVAINSPPRFYKLKAKNAQGLHLLKQEAGRVRRDRKAQEKRAEKQEQAEALKKVGERAEALKVQLEETEKERLALADAGGGGALPKSVTKAKGKKGSRSIRFEAWI